MNFFLQRFLLFCLLGALLSAAASAETTLPTPPQQSLPWTPPAGLPAPFVSATATLFMEGLGDPRSGEYRQISVHVGSVWSGDGGIVQVHGWVLPQPATGERYAVCWNGLVYPVISVGDHADLSTDVEALVKTSAEARASYAKTNPAQPYFRFLRGAIPESQSVSETSLLPLKAALLLRLGAGELAQKFWQEWRAGTPPNVNDNTEALQDPYLLMADEWVWALFDRAVTAHMRGDDRLSLISARQLTRLQAVVEAEAKRHQYQQTPSRGVHEAGTPYFPYLEPLPRLLADEERRTAEAAPPPVLADIKALPDKQARIAALIAALDQVAARQWGQPGSVSPDSDPLVQALVAQGDNAVQSLIDTVRDDTRLTRSVGFGRDFFQDRYLVSVSRAAYDAAVGILHTSEFGATGLPNDKAANAAALQAYWDKYGNFSVAERCYKTLADDTAAPAQWIDAAHEIVRPSDEVLRGGWIERSQGFKGNAPPKGEPLRHGHTPSVSALMARRVSDVVALSQTRNGDSRQYDDVEDADTLALYFTAWDPQAAQPVLRRQFETERMNLDHWSHMMTVTEGGDNLIKLTLARMYSGDSTAVIDFVSWLKGQPFRALPISFLGDVFEPLWRDPHNPAAHQGAKYFFLNPHSLWVPLVRDEPGYGYGPFENALESPLLLLPAFRQAMLLSLTDHTVLRTITLGGPNPQTEYDSIGNNQDLDPFRPATPQSFPIRRCDLYAWHLSQIGGMPAFQYDWPTHKKDAAIAEAAARLQHYGGNFASDLPPVLPGILPGEGGLPQVPTPRLSFPSLSRPASALDVAQNKAIFALGPGGRVLSLPLPLAARWVKDHRYPRHEVVWTAPKSFNEVIGYAQDGLVWQAEETAKGQRFYGFVGPHDIARVAAEEMTFPPTNIYNWTQISPGLDCEIDLNSLPAPYLTSLKSGQPLSLTIRLRSRLGTVQTLPANFLRRQLALKLLFSPDAATGEPLSPTDPKRNWTEVLLQRRPTLPSTPLQRLEPTEEFSAWTVDPHDEFDLSRPGNYRLQLIFTSASAMTGRQIPEAAFRIMR